MCLDLESCLLTPGVFREGPITRAGGSQARILRVCGLGAFIITPEHARRWMDKGVQLITFGITPVIARGTRDMVQAIQTRGRM